MSIRGTVYVLLIIAGAAALILFAIGQGAH